MELTKFLIGMGGAAVFGLLIFTVLVLDAVVREGLRSYKQTCRKARVVLGHGWRRKVGRSFFTAWAREFFNTYETLRIGLFELPYDVSKPVRRERW
jgi:hypothetical protein